MSNSEYLSLRAQFELRAAIHSVDRRVREIHLELADAYAFRLREESAIEQGKRLVLSPV
jgi:hypothetical protein